LDTAGCTQRLSAFGIKWKIKELKGKKKRYKVQDVRFKV